MRPSSGGDGLPSTKPPSRKSSAATPPALQPGSSSHGPTTFFMRSEGDMDGAVSSSLHTDTSTRQSDSTFGVQSLADTLEAAFGQESRLLDTKAENTGQTTKNEKDGPISSAEASPKATGKATNATRSSPARKHRRRASDLTLSTPMTPLNPDARSPIRPFAMPSTPKSVSLQSLKLSDEESGVDDATSQAVTSGGEDEENETATNPNESFPQLVMPSIQMPARRPFTTKGKAMGRLKVLVAGESGIGKTSLIRSIVQLCEDIVHVDPLSPTQSFSHSPPLNPKGRRRSERLGTTRIQEVHASTKAYPHWWTDLEESKVLRRRKSSSDTVLERNICFIDTPGLDKSVKGEDTEMVFDYVESLLHQNCSVASMDDSDLLAVIGGNGGVQVDLVIYLLGPRHDISKDMELMQRFSEMTNIIPVIARSDLISASEAIAIKTSVLARLQTTSMKPFFFGKAIEDALLDVQGLPLAKPSPSSSPASSTSPDLAKTTDVAEYPFDIPTYPYAISSNTGPDIDNMDASLLMSPDYVQPLLPSELNTLVKQVFDPEAIAWLRHSSAKKFLTWRRRAKLPSESYILHGLQQKRLQRGSIAGSSMSLHGAAAINTSGVYSVFSDASPSGVLVPRATSPFYQSNLNSSLQSPYPASSPSLSHTNIEGDGPTELSLARFNYTAGEHRLSEVRLAKWATDLQRSLRNERDRYEEIQRSERARWLLERVSEEVREGNIVSSPNGSPRAEWAVTKHGSKEISGTGRYVRAGNVDSRDPLGLCDFSDELRKRGFVLVKVLGGMSVLGAVMLAAIKACGLETGLPEGGIWSWLTTGTAE